MSLFDTILGDIQKGVGAGLGIYSAVSTTEANARLANLNVQTQAMLAAKAPVAAGILGNSTVFILVILAILAVVVIFIFRK